MNYGFIYGFIFEYKLNLSFKNMPPKKKIFFNQIRDQDHYHQVLSENPTRVNIIDCHLEWCGPCKCMEPNYQALWFSIEDGDPEGRVAFWQCQEEHLPDDLQAKLALSLIPKFIIVKGGDIKKEITGARLVEIQETMMDLLPEIEE